MNKLILAIEEKELSQTSEVRFSIYNDQGVPLIDNEREALGTLKSTIANLSSENQLLEGALRVFVLANGEEVLFSSVTIPSKQKKHIQKALPYLIEDQLATSLDESFFALGNAKGFDLPVAVVAQGLLKNWVDALNAAGFYPEAIYPEYSALADHNKGNSILCFCEGRVLAFQRDGKAYSFSKELLSIYLRSIILSEQSETLIAEKENPSVDDDKNVNEDQVPGDSGSENDTADLIRINIVITGVDEAPDDHADLILRLQEAIKLIEQEMSVEVSITTEMVGQSGFAFLCSKLAVAPKNNEMINLLQAEFKSKRSPSKLNLNFSWKPISALVSILFVVYSAFVYMEARSLEKKLAEVEEDTKQVFREIFPRTRNYSRMKFRVSELLGDSGNAGESHFYKSIYLLSKGLDQVNSAEPGLLVPKQINFEQKSRELRFDLFANTYENLDAFKSFAESNGFFVEITSANSEKDKIKGRLKMRLEE